MEEFVGLALRITFMYLYALAIVLISGRRTIGAVTPVDVAVVVVVGDMFDDVFWAEIPLSQGIVGMTTIVLLHTIVSYASYKSKTIDKIVGAEKVTLVRLGRVVADGLRRERLREEDLLAQLRFWDVEHIDEVNEASFEPSGRVSVLMREENKPAEKRDLPALREHMR